MEHPCISLTNLQWSVESHYQSSIDELALIFHLVYLSHAMLISQCLILHHFPPLAVVLTILLIIPLRLNLQPSFLLCFLIFLHLFLIFLPFNQLFLFPLIFSWSLKDHSTYKNNYSFNEFRKLTSTFIIKLNFFYVNFPFKKWYHSTIFIIFCLSLKSSYRCLFIPMSCLSDFCWQVFNSFFHFFFICLDRKYWIWKDSFIDLLILIQE